MKKIPSFLKDHDKITPGFSVSMTDKDLTTYDLRFVHPNSGKYMSTAAMHTIEHLMATTLRNGDKSSSVVYFGPMGCRTGFYLIMRDTCPEDALSYTVECLTRSLLIQEIPGGDRKSCGNYREHNLTSAKYHLKRYHRVLKDFGAD